VKVHLTLQPGSFPSRRTQRVSRIEVVFNLVVLQQEHLLPKSDPVSLSPSILALKYINDIHDMHKIIFLLIDISVFVIVINSPPRERHCAGLPLQLST
jgi:hypothetical protein